MQINLGNLETAAGHFEGALGAYQKALELEPNLPFALLGIAGVHIRRGNDADARQCTSPLDSQRLCMMIFFPMMACSQHLPK